MTRAASLGFVVAVLASDCSASSERSNGSSSHPYAVSATIACLKKRPEYVPGFPRPVTEATRLEMSVSKPDLFRSGARDTYYYFFVPAGASKLTVSFDGPAPNLGESQGDLQSAFIYLLPNVPAARRIYESLYPKAAAAGLHPEQMLQRRRNVAIIWVRPDPSSRFRTIVLGCLRAQR